MKDYEAHVTDTRTGNTKKGKHAYCGVRISMEWTFIDAEHMLNVIKNKGRMLPCPECKKKIIELLNTE